MIRRASYAALQRHHVSVGERQAIELDDDTIIRTEVTCRERLHPQSLRFRLERVNVAADDRSRRHDDPVVGVDGIDQCSGYGLADTRDPHTFRERNPQRSSGLDDELDGCRRRSALRANRQTWQQYEERRQRSREKNIGAHGTKCGPPRESLSCQSHRAYRDPAPRRRVPGNRSSDDTQAGCRDAHD